MTAREELVTQSLEFARDEVAALLEAHILDKGVGLCRCGAEMNTKGHRTAEHRLHVTDALLASPALASLIREKQADALREAAHVYGVIWGSGLTTEAQVGEVLNHWATHGIGARMDSADQTEEPT